MLSQETIQAVRSYPDMGLIVQDYVRLRRQGRNLVGLCPFHSEKTPSFTVSPEKQLFYCFGCQASGDLIDFIQRMEHLGFQESVEFIARRVGIAIEMAPESARVYSQEDRLRHDVQTLLSKARQLFSTQLPDSLAHAYLVSRGVSQQTMVRFDLGYCSLMAVSQIRDVLGAPIELLESSGLGTMTHGQFVCPFRDRLIIPVFDERGKTVGFGARRLDNETLAKYINSEETLVFNKRRLLYGLHLAKAEIKKQDAVILVEGYLDVMMMYQHGFFNTVAAMGTALTGEQVQRLKRLCSQVFLALDQDQAGQAAIERAYIILSDNNIRVRVLKFSEKDPAEQLAKVGASGMQKIMDESVSFVAFKFEKLIKEIGIGSIQHVSKIIDAIVPFLKKESDTVVRHYYVKDFAKTLGVDQEILMAKVSDVGYTLPRKRLFQTPQQRQNKYILAEEHLLFFMASDKEAQAGICHRLGDSHLVTDAGQALANAIVSLGLVHHALLSALPQIDSQRVSQLLVKYSGESAQNWTLYCDMILQYHREQRIQFLKTYIRDLEAGQQEELLEEAMGELQSLMEVG